MADKFVNIEHPGTGEGYAVRESDFRKGAEGPYKGFRIVGYEDGTPYEGPKTAAGVAKAEKDEK